MNYVIDKTLKEFCTKTNNFEYVIDNFNPNVFRYMDSTIHSYFTSLYKDNEELYNKLLTLDKLSVKLVNLNTEMNKVMDKIYNIKEELKKENIFI